MDNFEFIPRNEVDENHPLFGAKKQDRENAIGNFYRLMGHIPETERLMSQRHALLQQASSEDLLKRLTVEKEVGMNTESYQRSLSLRRSLQTKNTDAWSLNKIAQIPITEADGSGDLHGTDGHGHGYMHITNHSFRWTGLNTQMRDVLDKTIMPTEQDHFIKELVKMKQGKDVHRFCSPAKIKGLIEVCLRSMYLNAATRGVLNFWVSLGELKETHMIDLITLFRGTYEVNQTARLANAILDRDSDKSLTALNSFCEANPIICKQWSENTYHRYYPTGCHPKAQKHDWERNNRNKWLGDNRYIWLRDCLKANLPRFSAQERRKLEALLSNAPDKKPNANS